MYGAIFVGLFAALFGGTPAQVSGPTGPMTVVMAVIFTQYTALYPDDPATGAALAFTVVMIGGVFQILFGVLRLGKYINLIPHPVISGFMSGIGVIIILLQIGPLLGHPAPGRPLAAAQAIPEFLLTPVPDAVVLGLVALIIVYFLPKRINDILPSPLVALLIGTAGVYLIYGGAVTTQEVGGNTQYLLGRATILGDIPTGFPNPQFPVIELGLLTDMIKSALILATLGAIDSLLTSLVADNVTRTYHDSERELIGQGIGNTIAGAFGGLPGAGATMRTVVNVRAGGRTPISGALHAIVLLAVVLGAGGFARYIPHAVLAGILIKVGTDIIDWDYLKRLKTAPKAGVSMMFTVLFLTVFVDLITAVAIGMIMASMVFMQRMVNLQLDSISAITEPQPEAQLSKEEEEIMREAGGQILLFHLSGPMSFGAAKGTARRLAAFDQYDILIVDLTDVPQVDFTSSRAIDDMVHDAVDRGGHALLVGARPTVCSMLIRQGALLFVPEDHRFQHRSDALRHALNLIKEKTAREEVS
jgi:SulP family sulfate permease